MTSDLKEFLINADKAFQWYDFKSLWDIDYASPWNSYWMALLSKDVYIIDATWKKSLYKVIVWCKDWTTEVESITCNFIYNV